LSPIGSPARGALASLLILLPLLAGCAGSGPAIQEVLPHKGDTGVAADAEIRVTFDRPMDRASVESRVRLEPAIRGCQQACAVAWEGQTMVLRHSGHELQSATHYTVRLLGGYRDATGVAATLEHAWDFTVEDAPTLRASTPAGGARGVAPDADLVLQFSRRMLFPDPGAITLEPATPVRLGLDPQDQSRVVVSPLGPLTSGTGYRLVVSPQLRDATHNALGQGYTVSFTTGPLDLQRVLAVAVRDGGGVPRALVGLRPGRAPDSPPPTPRVLYRATAAIRDYGWSFDARRLYVLDGRGRLLALDPATGIASDLGLSATAMAVSRARDELAYLDQQARLHLWSPAGGDIAAPQAGTLAGAPAWSGDGRRLAVAVAAPESAGGGGAGSGGAAGLAIVDRDTLSRYLVPGVDLAASPAFAWSADGFALAFVRQQPGGPEVWTYRPLDTGTRLERVGALDARGLAWSDDGGTIFAAAVAGIFSAASRAVGGPNAGFALVAGSLPGDANPATTPADPRVAFTRTVAGVAQLWLMNPDGSAIRQLTSADYDPADGLVPSGVDLPRWAPVAPAG
jgi:hypothetical protein